MLDPSTVFDPDRARRPPLRALGAELRALRPGRRRPPPPADMPDGRGRAVLVIPAFLTGDAFTRALRGYLARCGFQAYACGVAVNWGPTPKLLARLDTRLDDLAARHGQVALVGVSLGGLLARDLAHRRPDRVVHVVTVASPLRLPTASRLEPVVRALSRFYAADIDMARLATPLPVPSTMIYTTEDGIVPPDDCWSDEPGSLTLALQGPHLTLASTADAMAAIVRRLAP